MDPKLATLAASEGRADAPTTTRRGFLRVSAASCGGMLLALALGPAAHRAAQAQPAPPAFAPNAWIRIGADGVVTMTMGFVEMGQGTYTSVPMLLAEELELPLSQVRLEHAPPDDQAFMNPALGFQVTGGSTTIRGSFDVLRRAGATARTMLVAAAAARWGVDPASCSAADGVVVHAPSGRRAGYGALAADAARQPVPAEVVLKPPSQFRLIGTPVRRLDSAGKVDGSAKYGIDAMPPGVRFATLAQSPVVGGRLRAVDAGAAMAVRGVRQVVQLDDVVAVVADHLGAARKGLAALAPQWDDGPNAGLSTASIVASMRAASREGGVVVARQGDFDAALAAAPKRLRAEYELPFLIHAAMEPLNCTVHVRPDGCELWLGTQVITRARDAAARVTGLPPGRVTVHNHLLGGGFGRRLEIDSVERAVQIARHVDGPVKVVWSREEDTQHDMFRPYFFDELEAGLDAAGRPVAWRHRITGSSVLKRWAPPLYRDGADPETTDGAAQPPYAFANLRVEYCNHEPPIPTAFWRGVGPTHNVFVVESFVDELAAAAGTDPVAFRLAALAEQPRAAAVLQRVAREAGWGTPLPARAGRGVSLQFAFGTWMAMVGEVEVDADGNTRVRRVTVALDTGIVVNPDTVVAQVQSAVIFGISAVLWGEATVADGRIQQSNFHDVRVVRIDEAPRIDVHIVRSTEAPGGMGEPGTSGLAPAVTNAIFAATGRRLRKLPVDAALLKA